MKKLPLLEKAAMICDELAMFKQDPGSHRFEQEDPIAFAVTRRRQFNSAVANGDYEMKQQVIKDISSIIGIDNIQRWINIGKSF